MPSRLEYEDSRILTLHKRCVIIGVVQTEVGEAWKQRPVAVSQRDDLGEVSLHLVGSFVFAPSPLWRRAQKKGPAHWDWLNMRWSLRRHGPSTR